MRIFCFDREVGKSIDAHGSSGFILSRIVRLSDEADVKCAYLSPGGRMAYHQTTKDQLFVVVQGDGWVKGEFPEAECPVRAGQAVFWEEGDWHESGTETGMVAIVIEGENIDPTTTMPPV